MEGLGELDDSALLERARSGDQSAATAFARRHTQWAIALAWRNGAGADSEDIVQTLLAKLLVGETQPVFRSLSARPYLQTAIVRRSRAVFEVRSRVAHAVDDQWPNDQTSVTGRLARAEDRSAVRRSIESLPDYQRQVVELQAEGLANAEIAETVGRKPGVVRVYLSRAVISLRDSLR